MSYALDWYEHHDPYRPLGILIDMKKRYLWNPLVLGLHDRVFET
eukprot:SAG11_NODE_19861_length_457_cov_1.159218_1_plen_43_part_01